MKTKSSPETKESTSYSNDDVSAALNFLAESLHTEVQRINAEGAQAMHGGDYDTAQSVIDFAKRLTAFRSKVDLLGREWNELEDLRDKATPAVQEIVSKRFFGRKKSGEITGFMEFCPALLQILEEIGGRGKTKDVLDLVGERMKGTLKPKDYRKTSARN